MKAFFEEYGMVAVIMVSIVALVALTQLQNIDYSNSNPNSLLYSTNTDAKHIKDVYVADPDITDIKIIYHIDDFNVGEYYYPSGSKVALLVPNKDGYTFDGWCKNSDLSDTPINEIESLTANEELYAHWTIKS